MAEQQNDQRPKAIVRESLAETQAFATEAVLEAFEEAALDNALWQAAKNDPRDFFRGRDVVIPDWLDVTFEDRVSLPVPNGKLGWEPLGILGWRCMKYCRLVREDESDPDSRLIWLCIDVCLPVIGVVRPFINTRPLP